MSVIARIAALVVRKFSALFGRSPAPPVVVYDPAASDARDLDQTFFDTKAQERVGKAISNSKRSDVR